MADPDAQKAKRQALEAIKEAATKGVPLKEGEEPSLAGITREEMGVGLAGARSHEKLLQRQAKKERWIQDHRKKTGKSYWEAEKQWRTEARQNRLDKYKYTTSSERNPYHREKKTVAAKQEIKGPDGKTFEVDTTKDIYTHKQGTPIDDAMKLARRGIEQFAKKRGLQTILRNGEIFVKRGLNPAMAMYGVNDVQGGETRRVDVPEGKANEFWSNGQLQQVIVDKGDGKYQIIKNPKKVKEYVEERMVQGEAAIDTAALRVDPPVDNRAREAF